ncbi:hypothetical protein NC651_039692 [Populus alba x Populus x berolinensis]|nr:hypothetical protein NC651_039692 [Populus alba x Populus x berolinensis]
MLQQYNTSRTELLLHDQQQFLTLRLHTFPVNLMAYIPPHKRHSKDVRTAAPIPETLQPQFQRNMNLRASTSRKTKSGKIVDEDTTIYKWFAVGLDEDGQFPPYIHLEPISFEYIERKTGEKPLVLVNSIVTEEDSKLERTCSRSPWEIIAENLQKELLSSFEILRNEMDDQGSEKLKPELVARMGKIAFRGNYLMGLESVNKIQVEEAILRQLNRSLYTDIPSSYMENIIDGVVPEIGIDFEEEKDVYTVKLSDNTRPDATVLCKCIVVENKKLQLYKAGFVSLRVSSSHVKLNKVRQLVIDVSCLDKNLDLRLMLCTSRILTSLTDEEMNSLRDLMNSAVLDSDMKGGLRWPLGEEASSGGRYSVIGVWHTVTKAYKSSSLRLKARDADGYNFKTGTGETLREIYLKLKRILSEIQASSFIEDSKLERTCSRSPWEIIAENVQQELLSSFEILRNEMDDQGSEKLKPELVARMGKIAFRGNYLMGLESVNKIQVEEAILRQLNRSLYTDIPSSYMENIIDGVVPAIGIDFEEEKDVYIVKVKLNKVRQLVIDVSCLDKNLDLRLMLCTSRILTSLTEPGDESDSISKMLEDSLRLIWDKSKYAESLQILFHMFSIKGNIAYGSQK